MQPILIDRRQLMTERGVEIFDNFGLAFHFLLRSSAQGKRSEAELVRPARNNGRGSCRIYPENQGEESGDFRAKSRGVRFQAGLVNNLAHRTHAAPALRLAAEMPVNLARRARRARSSKRSTNLLVAQHTAGADDHSPEPAFDSETKEKVSCSIQEGNQKHNL
jgi:hypothetical protein